MVILEEEAVNVADMRQYVARLLSEHYEVETVEVRVRAPPS